MNRSYVVLCVLTLLAIAHRDAHGWELQSNNTSSPAAKTAENLCSYSNVDPNPCDECNTHAECEEGEKCCKGPKRKCCRTPTETPVVNPYCEHFTPTGKGCAACTTNEDCGDIKGQICCNHEAKVCCGKRAKPSRCEYSNVTPNPCHSCTKDDECPATTRCCRSGRRNCCRSPVEPPLENPVCLGVIHRSPQCKECSNSADCPDPTSPICCNTQGLTCCVSKDRERIGCPTLQESPNTCNPCFEDEDCEYGKSCCHAGDAKCCLPPPKGVCPAYLPKVTTSSENCTFCSDRKVCPAGYMCCRYSHPEKFTIYGCCMSISSSTNTPRLTSRSGKTVPPEENTPAMLRTPSPPANKIPKTGTCSKPSLKYLTPQQCVPCDRYGRCYGDRTCCYTKQLSRYCCITDAPVVSVPYFMHPCQYLTFFSITAKDCYPCSVSGDCHPSDQCCPVYDLRLSCCIPKLPTGK